MYAALDMVEEMNMEHVDFSAIPKTYGINFRLQEIVYRAKAKMELFFAELMLSKQILIAEVNEYMELIKKRYYWQNIVNAISFGQFCPEPPSGVKKIECMLPNGETYYSIRTLWDLQHELDIEDTTKEYFLKWREVYYLHDDTSISCDHWNRNYYDYSERGQEFLMTEDVYFIEDLGRWVMVEACYESY